MSTIESNEQTLGDDGQLVVFGLGEEEFGVDIHAVREIVRLPEVTPIPRSPEYATGICNLRGSVLPVIDTRCRFGLEPIEPTDQSRMLVVESSGTSTGIIVDNMREVLRLHGTAIEDTPGVCRGVDDAFLSGVVSLDKGKRLIMALNLEQIINIEIEENSTGLSITGGGSSKDDGTENDVSEMEQLVSFQVGLEEYALDINAVNEILRVTEITEVPNVPDFVKGLFTIRNKLMPVVDLRNLLGMDVMARQHITNIDTIKASHSSWVQELSTSLSTGNTFTGETDPRRCEFGLWMEEFNTASQEIQNKLKELRGPHTMLHQSAEPLLQLAKISKDEAMEQFEQKVQPLLQSNLNLLDNLKKVIEANIHEDQRILVVDDGELTVGYLVDHVNEVIRVSKSIINETPTIAKTVKSEIRGVAKLDEGKRLILIMDEGAILTGSDNKALAEIEIATDTADDESEEEVMAEGDEDAKTLEEQSLEEEQLVTFLLDKEEYGLRIMDVQEINRLEEITEIPKAPSFIDGVTNLRGNIIPVLNIRNLFGMDPRENDDKSRIVIVDISGSKTGVLVDQVNEVMRLSKNDIDKTPAIVTGAGNRFMDGICKLDGGKRIITMLNVSQLLDSDEMADFTAMGDKKKPAGKTKAKKNPTKKKLKIAE